MPLLHQIQHRPRLLIGAAEIVFDGVLADPSSAPEVPEPAAVSAAAAPSSP